MIKFRPDPKPNFAAERLNRKANIARDKKNAARSHAMFYKSVWNSNPHKCFECGEPLPEFDKCLCHHLIEKNKKSQKQYSISLDNTENGVILCLICHDQVRLNLSKLPKTQAQTFIMKAKYEQFKIKR